MTHAMLHSETHNQATARLEAAAQGKRLFRNNVGVLKDQNGRPVRYGLANESKALNTILKSSDLVGWETVTITADMVGQKIARFLSAECKPEGWKFNPNDAHEVAQKRWLDMINADGGRGLFVSGPGQL